MKLNRREFLKRLGLITGGTILTLPSISQAYTKGSDTSIYATGNKANSRNWKIYEERKKKHLPSPSEPYGVLVDVSKCIGCRRCEWACNEWNQNPNRPLREFEASVHQKPSVFDKMRRPHAGQFTVVNRFYAKDGTPIYVKKQCMHCIEPACYSACFVEAFRKTKEGPVIYNPHVCIGCRYCMVACPFDIPAYEYYDPITPQVTKCTMCYDRIVEGKVPACVEICTAGALTFGKRSELLKLAWERIMNNPGKYYPYVYGEKEVGGTSWLYISPVPFEEIGFRTDLGEIPISEHSEKFLFTVKFFEVVAAWPLVFGAYYQISKNRKKVNLKDKEREGDSEK